jgi:hypothetical protein
LADLCPEIDRQELYKSQIYFDPIKKHHYAKVDFHAVKKFIPDFLKKKVNDDNSSFMIEKYMFNPGFFESSTSMIDLMLKAYPEAMFEDNPYSGGIFSFVEKLVFEILPWGKKTNDV